MVLYTKAVHWSINDDRREGIYLFKPSCVAEKHNEFSSCGWLTFCLLLTPKLFKEAQRKIHARRGKCPFPSPLLALLSKHREKRLAKQGLNWRSKTPSPPPQAPKA